MKSKILTASIIGNALEYYDFTIYAVFSVEIGKLFFPKQDDFAQLFLSLAVFAVGFLMRPLGAIFFGHIGDRLGRKRALTLSIGCMAIPTFAIGCMPGFEVIGLWAPALLVLCRLIQGISIGGEGAGSAIFILEHNKNIGFGTLGGIITASNFIGAFIATLVGLGITHLTSSAVGWRYAFILGGLLGMVGFYLRIRATETPVFEALAVNKHIVKIPLLKALKENPKPVLLSVCLGGIAGSAAYIILAYVNLFFSRIIGLSPTESLRYAVLGMGSYILLLPIFGRLSDRVGYNKTLIQSCVGMFIFAMPVFTTMSLNHPLLNIVAIIALAALAAWNCAPAYPFMLQMFPAEQRYSGMAFSFNLGLALFGGTTPIISAYLSKLTGLSYAPSFYLMGLVSLYLICYWLVAAPRQTTKDGLAFSV